MAIDFSGKAVRASGAFFYMIQDNVVYLTGAHVVHKIVIGFVIDGTVYVTPEGFTARVLIDMGAQPIDQALFKLLYEQL